MRVHVALSPVHFAAIRLERRAALVVDVIRASTTVVAACAAGCRRVVPVRDRHAALRLARALSGAEVVLAGESDGETIPGFALGNSPREYTEERVRGRTVVLTTTNGTAAMLAAARAATAAVAAFSNVEAAARWTAAQDRDVTVLCAGEKGEVSLEDAVCAGFLVEALAAAGADVDATDAATTARRAAHFYAPRLSRLAEDSKWARRLIGRGGQADVDVCLTLAGLDDVPVLRDGAVVPGDRTGGAAWSGEAVPRRGTARAGRSAAIPPRSS